MSIGPGLGKNLDHGDSIGVCLDPRSFTEVIRNNGKVPPSTVFVRIDTIQPEPESVDSKLLDTFKNNYPWFFLGLAFGKLCLIVLLVPFRFTLFKFPRFVFLTIIPAALHALKPIPEAISKQKVKVDKFILGLKLLLGRLKPRLDLAKKLLDKMSKKVVEHFRRAFLKVIVPVVTMGKGVKAFIHKSFNRAMVEVSPIVRFLKNGVVQVKKRVSQIAFFPLMLKRGAEQFLSEGTLRGKVFEFANHVVAKTIEKISGTGFIINQAVQVKAAQAMVYVRHMAEVARSQVTIYARPLGQIAAEAFKKVTNLIKSPALAFAKVVTNRVQDFRSIVIHSSEKVVAFLKQPFGALQTGLEKLQIPKVVQSAKLAAVEFVQGKIHAVVRFVEKLTRGLAPIIRSFERIKIVVKEMMNKMGEKGRQLFQKFKKRALELKKKALSYVEAAKRRALNGFKGFLGFLRALVDFSKKLKAFFREFLILGKQLFRELVLELRNWS